MKKLMMAAIGLMMAVSVNAQYLNDSDKVFSQDKWYVGASLSGFDLSWHKASEWTLNVQAKGGYMFLDDWMLTGRLGSNYSGAYRSTNRSADRGTYYYGGYYTGTDRNTDGDAYRNADRNAF